MIIAGRIMRRTSRPGVRACLATPGTAGRQTVVVDPQQSRALGKPTSGYQIRPATDGAFLFGMMHTLLHELNLRRRVPKRYANAA
jgi:anaerobic selenocysteine-containing dehydrogenase